MRDKTPLRTSSKTSNVLAVNAVATLRVSSSWPEVSARSSGDLMISNLSLASHVPRHAWHASCPGLPNEGETVSSADLAFGDDPVRLRSSVLSNCVLAFMVAGKSYNLDFGHCRGLLKGLAQFHCRELKSQIAKSLHAFRDGNFHLGQTRVHHFQAGASPRLATRAFNWQTQNPNPLRHKQSICIPLCSSRRGCLRMKRT